MTKFELLSAPLDFAAARARLQAQLNPPQTRCVATPPPPFRCALPPIEVKPFAHDWQRVEEGTHLAMILDTSRQSAHTHLWFCHRCHSKVELTKILNPTFEEASRWASLVYGTDISDIFQAKLDLLKSECMGDYNGRHSF